MQYTTFPPPYQTVIRYKAAVPIQVGETVMSTGLNIVAPLISIADYNKAIGVALSSSDNLGTVYVSVYWEPRRHPNEHG